MPVFKYMNKNIEIVKTFHYLGIVFTSNGTFHNAVKTLTGKATQAASNLFTITQNKEIPIKTMIGLFDAFVASIIYYSCEVWGILNSDLVERLHRTFLKRLINVKSSTSNSALYGEFGRYPLAINVKVRIMKYFIKLFQYKQNNCIFQAIMNMSNKLHTNTNIDWFNNVKFMFESNGFYEIWLFPSSVNLKAFTPVFCNRFIDNYLIHWHIDIRSRSSLTLFRHIKSTFDISE